MDRNKRKVRLTSCSSYENKKPLFHTFCHKKSHEVRRCEIEACIVSCIFMYRISANSFRGNYSFLNLALFTVTFDLYFINLNSCSGNYSREETIQGRKLFAEIRYVGQHFCCCFSFSQYRKCLLSTDKCCHTYIHSIYFFLNILKFN